MRIGPVDNPKHEICPVSPRQSPPHAFALDGAAALSQARRVRDDDRQTANIQVHLDHVARGPGFFRDDGDVTLGQRIEDRGFARVWRPGDDHVKPLAQALAAMAREMFFHLTQKRHNNRLRLTHGIAGDIGLIGEVEPGLH